MSDDHAEPDTSANGGSSEPPEPEPDEPGGFDRWRRESAIGEVGTSIAKGLRNIFAPTQQEVVIVASVPGDPPDAAERLRVVLDPDDPTKSVAILPKPGPEAHPADGAGTAPD